MFTRTFRVGLRTCIEHLRRSASDYWGLHDSNTVLYLIEEDGTLRDLQFEQNSCVTKIVEQYHTQALRHRSWWQSSCQTGSRKRR